MDTIGDEYMNRFLLINSNDSDAFVALTKNDTNFVSKASDFIQDGNYEQKKPDKLINCLEKISNEHNLTDIDAIAVTIGPGSFTGIRVGLSLAKGLAFGLGKNIIPITNFHLIFNSMNTVSHSENYCILIPAKLPEYYFSYIKKRNEIQSGCTEFENLEKIADANTIFVADFDDESKIKHSYFKFVNTKNLKTKVDSMVELTQKYFSTGNLESPEDVEPLYLKDFAAKIPISNS